MNQLEQWEWIDAYHSGALPDRERQRLEEKMVTDEAFRREATALGAARTALQELALTDLVRQTVRQELASEQRPRYRWQGWRWVAAASLLLVLGISYLTFSRVDLGTYRNDLTLTERYRQLPDNQPEEDALTAAQRAFYRQFFDAQAYLATGQPRPAIEKLEALAAVEGVRPYFRDAVAWHLLNAYLLDHQPDNAAATYQRLLQQSASSYPISLTDRWKVWWQIRWQKLASG
ncbi:anti-sigma factor [Fibrella sp. WM1]|uniref:anti-sigma factor n=1 Tax=Fibrella musci TaxID=3242485 RepID=UPI003522CCFC